MGLPFHLDSRTVAPVMASLDHSWKSSHAEWARHDVRVKHKTAMAKAYFRRDDLPFHHALAHAFTIGDPYFCSLHGPTNPNRLFLFSGTSGLAIGVAGEQCVSNVDDDNWTAAMASYRAGFAGWRWTSYAERLTAAAVSWKVYLEYDNYGDNPLACFARYRGANAHPALVAGARAIEPGLIAYGSERRTFTLAPGTRRTERWPIAASDQWYDVAITTADGFVRRFAGHVETGRPSRSDPAIGRDLLESVMGKWV